MKAQVFSERLNGAIVNLGFSLSKSNGLHILF